MRGGRVGGAFRRLWRRGSPQGGGAAPFTPGRRYAMDAVPPCDVFGPAAPPPPLPQTAAATTMGEGARQGRAANGPPPPWFESLCRDLFFRRGAAETPAAVDPYAWLPFELLDEADYDVAPYSFPAAAPFSDAMRARLCLGRPDRAYVHFCNTYAFPERHQLSTSIGTRPARLLMAPEEATPVVFLQLSPDFPPAAWLPIQPTAAAVRRVVGAFAAQAVCHRDQHHARNEERYAEAQRVMTLQGLPSKSAGDALRMMAYEARNVPYLAAPLREYRTHQDLFLGEYDDPERLLERFELSPYLFSIPEMRTVTELHAEHMTPTITGPGVSTSLFRCIYSKALVMVYVMLSAEVKLPPQDPEGFQFLWKDAQVVPQMRVPVFARILWPENSKLSGGGALVRRFNRLFGTEFAWETPMDAVLAVFYAMDWAQRLPDLLGVRGLRQRLAELEAATRFPDPPRLYPTTREIPNPEYTTQERIGMHVQYLSQVGDPEISGTIGQMRRTGSAPVRMGCAKAALIAGNRQLFHEIVSNEPPGRMQRYMTQLVRKRKARDLTNTEPMLLEDQFEFAAPLWTKRGTRIDRNTLEGALDAARMKR